MDAIKRFKTPASKECSMGLTPRELSEMAGELDRRRASLLAEIRHTLGDDGRESLALAEQGAGDIGDQSVADVLADFNVAMIDRHVNALHDVEQARVRIEKGVFGACVDCGSDSARAAAGLSDGETLRDLPAAT
jgi:RNA polymerase-binding transcription factor DksA